jgi:uracil-DNA glycosylase
MDANPDWISIKKLYAEILGWEEILSDPALVQEIENIDKELDKDLSIFGDFITFLPKSKDIFNAFNLCPFNNIKVCVIGMDPYVNIGEAHGLAFSVPKGVKFPPSLKNIFKEMSDDIPGFVIPESGDLTYLAKQGVLLLNTALTVRHKKTESHWHIWKNFTDRVIELISEKSKNSIVFMLWGNHAKQKEKLIDKRHYVLKANHPSPLSANRGGWFGCKHFSKVNEILEKNGLEKIKY